MKSDERSLVELVKHQRGRHGGFSFGGEQPDGVTPSEPLSRGTIYPNGARAALLLTFDVEGTYSNGTGDMEREIANYRRICRKLEEAHVPATFCVVGQMAEEHGPDCLEWMLEAGCEIASHGYVHDLNRRYGGDRVYAGHYGPTENLEQIHDGIEAIHRFFPDTVRGVRMPYGHFNEFTYDAMERLGVVWSSNVGIDDFLRPGQGFGPMPFRMRLGDKLYPIVEIPLDSQTYDWTIWMADEEANRSFVDAVRTYASTRNLAFERTFSGGVAIWNERMREAIDSQTSFTLLCHPINLAPKETGGHDPVEEFLFPVIDRLRELRQEGNAWVCTCGQMADFYRIRAGMGEGK